MDILNYLAPTRGYGGGGLITRIAHNAKMEEERKRQEEKNAQRSMAMAEAIRSLGKASKPADRVEVMANYAAQGYDFNDLRAFDQLYRGDRIKGADGYYYYSGTGERVLPGVQKTIKPTKRDIREGPDGLDRYVDTGEPVFPNVKPTPFNGYEPKYKLGEKDYDLLNDEIYGNLPDFGESDHLSPEIEQQVKSRAARYYGQTGNPTMAAERAFKEMNLPTSLDGYEKESGNWFTDDYYVPKSVSREGSNRGASNRIKISNGQETLVIPAERLKEAEKDGFKKVQ